MGGRGGLNIILFLPQKKWNVYNYENREKIGKDEEGAAREEQLQREQARQRDAEFRLERLRATRGLTQLNETSEPLEGTVEAESKSNHINLFEGIKIFDPVNVVEKDGSSETDGYKRKKKKRKV